MKKTSYFVKIAVPFGFHEIQLGDLTIYTVRVIFKSLTVEQSHSLICAGADSTLAKSGTQFHLITPNVLKYQYLLRALYFVSRSNAIAKLDKKYNTPWGYGGSD